MGSNPGTIYWMDVSDYIKTKIENKGSQLGHPKKKNFVPVQLLVVSTVGRTIQMISGPDLSRRNRPEIETREVKQSNLCLPNQA